MGRVNICNTWCGNSNVNCNINWYRWALKSWLQVVCCGTSLGNNLSGPLQVAHKSSMNNQNGLMVMASNNEWQVRTNRNGINQLANGCLMSLRYYIHRYRYHIHRYLSEEVDGWMIMGNSIIMNHSDVTRSYWLSIGTGTTSIGTLVKRWMVEW